MFAGKVRKSLSVLIVGVCLASTATLVWSQKQDEKKNPPKEAPPKVVVPPRNDRPGQGNENRNENRGKRPNQ